MKNLLCILFLPCLSLVATLQPEPSPDTMVQPESAAGSYSEPRCDIHCHDEFFSGPCGSFSLHCDETGHATYILEGHVCECADLQFYKADYCYAYYKQEKEGVCWAFSIHPDCQHWTQHSVWIKAKTSPTNMGQWRHFQCAHLHRVKSHCP